MKMNKRLAMMMLFGLMVLIAGCGKNIPAINQELLQSKKSVLMITKPDLNEQMGAAVQKTLLNWRDSHHIAFEWIHTDAFEAVQADKIKATPYDYVIVIGNELTRQAAASAVAITDKRWILLDDSVSQQPAAASGDNLVWRTTGDGFMEKQWQEWVKQQQIIGKRFEWVTVSSRPIPSMWAPSEEAETISLSDAEGWYPQFQLQVRQHVPDWIVVYSPLDASVLQRMKSLQVPIVNMSLTSIQVQWEPLLASLFDLIEKQWTPGVTNYDTQELTINKPQ
ncbi:hypothetical protein [Paenibacillus piri]|uniref:Uncharacterized protein n=1 Tax=Paenibacillus piri TaxID=2547395 RepID=A0A4R5KRW2_9BACL|nr:hypothetical protein [Paenibacillus piri]TDF98162.1 hypothetical protein E1757_11730 [Paenibacillus piri]